MSELLTCPFCGGEAIYGKSEASGRVRAVCVDCLASTDWLAGTDEAAAAWNRRVERTCKRRNHDTDNYYMRCCSCSRCNAGWFEDIYDKPFSYCPHCGAKVVG